MTEKSTKWNSLLPRVLTALIAGTALIFLVVFNYWTAYAMLSVISICCLWEFFQMSKKSGFKSYEKIGIFFALFLLVGNLFFQSSAYLFLGLFLVIAVSFMTFQKDKPSLNTLSSICMVLLYSIFPILSLFHEGVNADNYQWQYIIALFIMVWSFDTGAYFAGKLFGKNKMAPKISPGKTWEGTIGGMICCFLAIFFFSKAHGLFSTSQIILLSILLSASGTIGDLFISRIKRSIDIKDTGTILPGHGGFLDRFDGYLMSSIIYGSFLQLVG